MLKMSGLSTALAIVVLSLLFGGTAAWAQPHAPLEYKGGPVLETFKIVPLYWGKWKPEEIKAQQDYLKDLAAYISGVGAPKGQEPMLRQYGVDKASVADPVKANPNGVKGLAQKDIVNIIKNNAGKLPAFDAHTLIMVFLGAGSEVTDCGSPGGCGYHHSESDTAFWAAVPLSAGPSLALVSAHEVFEAATDSVDGKGWTSKDGEAVDGCNGKKYPFITLSYWKIQIPGAADNTQGGTCSTTGYIPISSEKKTMISVNNVTNETGGTLYVTGTGFTKGEQVHITVKNAPGLKGPQKIGTAVGTAKGKNGAISISIPYSVNPYSGLPGCGKGTTATVVVTIIATGDPEHEASTQIYLRNCGITWGA